MPLIADASPSNTVAPVHLAFVLLNEGVGDRQPPVGSNGSSQGNKNSLFASVIQKVGGDPVSSFLRYGDYIRRLCSLSDHN